MLTLKNICKTYNTKGGVEVKALNDVSLTFPETGMVFILGKSGSGKSTLLNVCGGLDTPDSGEIIICGRSSATFTGSDFDSYRNTFVGFIFQEYNILNEFTVEENLALALELQGKNKNKEKVEELLSQVDMSGYGKRKPNTLSGGQKQRIAIARALIKDPRIIMADEPTGALDSNTGKQVLDTLKKLSQSRLVIVVSHDREFAEKYGDRIIELKDGVVISDVSKTLAEPEKLGENISVIADGTLAVKSGKSLSPADLESIRRYVAEADSDVIISRSSGDITAFKKANRISDDNKSQSFAATDAANITEREYTAAESALVRSKLPAGKAVKMAASSLKVKPFRLFLTILLSVVAFVMFGVLSTLMTYNSDRVVISSYAQSYYDSIPLTKMYNVYRRGYVNGEISYEYSSYYSTYFTADDIAALNEKLGNNVTGIMELLESGSVSPYNVSADDKTPSALSGYSLKGVGCAPEGSAYRDMLVGTYPEANDEIAISQWYYTLLKSQNFYSVTLSDDGTSAKLGEKIEINSESDVIGQYLCFNVSKNPVTYVCYKITGVFSGGDIPSEFDGWDDGEVCDEWTNSELYTYKQYINESMHNVLLVCGTFCDNFVQTYGSTASAFTYDYTRYFSEVNFYYSKDSDIYISYASVYDPTSAYTLPVYWIGEEKTELSGNEIILDTDNLYVYLAYSTDFLTDAAAEEWAQSYAQKYGAAQAEAEELRDYYLALFEEDGGDKNSDENYQLYEYYSTIASAYGLLADIKNVPDFAYYLNYGSGYIDGDIYVEAICDYLNNYLPISTTVSLYNFYDTKEFEIVGFHAATDGYFYDGAYVSQSLYSEIKADNYTVLESNYTFTDDSIYAYAYVCYDGTESLISRVVDISNEVNADDSFAYISSNLYSDVISINSFVSILSRVFLYVGIALAIFAALLLFNFISVSIANKTHEIGVLRAVGARGWDVFKIFFAEAAIITAICLVIAIIGTIILVSYLNSVLTAGLGFPYILFSFGIISLLMMLAVAAAVAFLGTFIPVYRISRKKPVDSMRN